MTQKTISIREITLHRMVMRLKDPFTTSFGTFSDKEFFVVEMEDETGAIGFGESAAFSSPWYSEETVETNKHVMEQFLIPLLLESPINHPDEVSKRFEFIRRNNMAKSALEGAVWDLYAKRNGNPLYKELGGTKQQIEVGISIGIQPTAKDLVSVVEGYVNEGYKRMKVKIKPGADYEMLKEVRRHFPSILLMADANSAYTLDDIDTLKKLDDLDLMMIEQPLAHDDIIDHAKLQSELATPICLDESIHSFEDARKAIELGSCKIINIKIGRVGGITESKKIHDYCAQQGIPVWCGGMLEAGIGRAHNVAITTLPQFVIPGDTAGSSRYWENDIIDPEVIVENGVIHVPNKPGIGYEVNRKVLEHYRVSKTVFSNKNILA
ncbi:o-succinylbenzoate synthase [Bacillus luteolus]|uniref:o-succinylbenzoate synthase n=1 Tax=Litchfieldia luteola TaxID=682179 RepID=A0ABR9QLE9_9BACI|nr:o-succinylbenzoate synthase [Cytobacillus luteolus]MBE4909256.1 o-succinylbenzoate synthase [Cytobacillus luteolus]MBP1940287.1 O-succinylbenzoate synthase [Cytobacillus luteolus]